MAFNDVDEYLVFWHPLKNKMWTDTYCWQATGEDFSVEPTESRRPFRALLDVGLVKTTTGNRVFGALKVCLSLSSLIIKILCQ